MKDRYITATLALLAEGESPEVVLRGLERALAARDHNKLLPIILRGVLRRLEGRVSVKGPQVVVVDAASYETQKAVIQNHLQKLGAASAPTVAFDASLIGGAIVSNNYQRIDTTYKRALANLYARVTEHHN